MVGGLIEQQQVRALPGDQCQCKAGFLSAGAVLDGCQGLIATEPEATQVVAARLFTHFWVLALQLQQGRCGGVEHFQLLLVEVANAEFVALRAGAGQGRQYAGQGFEQGRLASAVGAEQRYALTGQQGQRQWRQHGRAMADHQVFHTEQRIRQPLGRGQRKPERVLALHRDDPLHALQRLQPALCLTGLGGLGPEPLHKPLHVLDPVLLAGKGRCLQSPPLRAGLFERAVVAGVELQLSGLDVHRVGGGLVEKIAVVRDQHQGAGEPIQKPFQPQQGVEVQVVGGLIEEQQVRWLHQRAGQGRAHTLSTGERRKGPGVQFRGDAKAGEDGGRPTFQPVAVDQLELGVEFGQQGAILRDLGSLDALVQGVGLKIAAHGDVQHG